MLLAILMFHTKNDLYHCQERGFLLRKKSISRQWLAKHSTLAVTCPFPEHAWVALEWIPVLVCLLWYGHKYAGIDGYKSHSHIILRVVYPVKQLILLLAVQLAWGVKSLQKSKVPTKWVSMMLRWYQTIFPPTLKAVGVSRSPWMGLLFLAHFTSSWTHLLCTPSLILILKACATPVIGRSVVPWFLQAMFRSFLEQDTEPQITPDEQVAPSKVISVTSVFFVHFEWSLRQSAIFR